MMGCSIYALLQRSSKSAVWVYLASMWSLCEKRWVMMVCFPRLKSTTSSRNHLNI